MEKEAMFLARAERLIESLAAERDNPNIVGNRDFVIRSLREMMAEVSSGALKPRELRYGNLTWLVGDQWPLGHPLSNEVGEVEALYRRL